MNCIHHCLCHDGGGGGGGGGVLDLVDQVERHDSISIKSFCSFVLARLVLLAGDVSQHSSGIGLLCLLNFKPKPRGLWF